ncbi:hypothetical protein [Chroococcidiopsis sp.]
MTQGNVISEQGVGSARAEGQRGNYQLPTTNYQLPSLLTYNLRLQLTSP